jgi:hypothetical protein
MDANVLEQDSISIFGLHGCRYRRPKCKLHCRADPHNSHNFCSVIGCLVSCNTTFVFCMNTDKVSEVRKIGRNASEVCVLVKMFLTTGVFDKCADSYASYKEPRELLSHIISMSG